MFVCEICKQDPTSHSFTILKKDVDITYFYTKPSIATKYYDADGIVYHYDGVLSENNSNWIWVFDGEGYITKHLLEFKVGFKLAHLITTKHSHNLQKIIIINPTWQLKTVLEMLKPFLSKRIKSLISMT
jgi:hypothetical protein